MRPGWAELFSASERRAFGGDVLRVTERGLWLPLPLDVVDAVAVEMGRLAREAKPEARFSVLDAGMGDGRIVAAVAADGAAHAYGIECEPSLFELARDNLERLRRLGDLPGFGAALGDYLALAPYRELDIRPSDVDVFVNYADGGELALARFVSEHARPRARLALVTADHTASVEGLSLVRRAELDRGANRPRFLMDVYEAQGE